MKNRADLHILVFLFWISPIGSICHAYATVLPDVLFCEHYNIDNGLRSNTIHQIFQDHNGFIWLATEEGLCRFDGYEFVFYQHDPASLESLSSNLLTSVLEDSHGILWIGTYKGLHSLELKTNQIRRHSHISTDLETQRVNRITFLLDDSSGKIWIGTRGGGLCSFDPEVEEFTWFRNVPGREDTFRSNYLYNATIEPTGTFLIGSQGGDLERFDPRTGTVEHLLPLPGPNEPGRPDILKIIVDQKKAIWYGMWNGGIARIDPQTGETRTFTHDPYNPASLSNSIVHSLFQDRSGNFLIGTDAGGIDLFDPTTEIFRHLKINARDKSFKERILVLTIFQDRTGGYWIGTRDHGLFHFDLKASWFDRYNYDPNHPEGLSNDKIFALCADRDGYVWVGTDGGGLDRFDSQAKTFTIYRHDPNNPSGLQNDTVISLLADRSGFLWIGYSNAGLSRMDLTNGTIRHFRLAEEEIRGSAVQCLYEDSAGKIWIGGQDYGINVYDPATNRFRYYPYNPDDPQSPSDRNFCCFIQGSDNSFWIGTLGFGLNRYDPETERFIVLQNDPHSLASLSGNMITCMCLDVQGRLWVGTEAGLDRLNPDGKTFTRYTTRDGLPSNMISAIVLDNDGLLWISSNRGLTCFNLQKETFQNFDPRDNLQGFSFNTNSACKAPNGELYFGGNNGFNRFHPRSIPLNDTIPPIILTSFKIMGRDYDWEEKSKTQDPIHLPFNQNFLQFEFTALNYIRSYRNQYKYMLTGLDPDWTVTSTRRYVQYTSLQPGHYEFRVIASNNDGVWNTQGISIPIVIHPPFWDTFWFRFTGAGSIVAALALTYKMRVRSIHKRRIELQREVERQTKRVVEQSQELERMNRELERLSFLDGLTNIPNRRRFEEHFALEWKRALRNQQPISLIMMDIDFFKKYNDTYGHQAGDDALQRVAQAIQSHARRITDLAARYGGEEFVLLLPETNAEDSQAITEALRQEIEKFEIPHEQSDISSYLTLSLGGATLIPQKETDPQTLLRLADEALYLAKQSGRNQSRWG